MVGRRISSICVALGFIVVSGVCSVAIADSAGQILSDTGLQGGLIVHLNCGTGELTADLGAGESYLVHGLDPDAGDIQSAQGHIDSSGLYGRVTAQEYDFDGLGRLPFVENLVNLIVSEVPVSVPMAEIMRVLAPEGTAYIHNGTGWDKTVKPRPAEIDEWTHQLYDASNNAVSHDTVVAPPRRFQWLGSPMWSRHHDRMSSVSACVSAGGRVFYIIDEGSRMSIQLPSKWHLIARDAFNGTILWKKPIESWITNMWPAKCGPAQLARRLVAIDDRVFVTLGLDGTALSCLDAATGSEIWTSKNTAMSEEIIYSEGTLFAMVKDGDPNSTLWNDYRTTERWLWDARNRASDLFPWDGANRKVTAIDPASGTILWQTETPVAPLSLAADTDHVYIHNGTGIVCFDRSDGSEVWSSAPVALQSPFSPKNGTSLVIYNGVVLFQGMDSGTTITALSTVDGSVLWDDSHAKTGHHCPYDLLCLDGQAWVGDIAGGASSAVFTGWDPNSGNTSEVPLDVEALWMHHRCYPAKATDNYFLTSRMGIEFVDPKAEQHWEIHHWVRGSCVYGIMPGNGLIYAPPHDCACFYQSQLFGFCALAGEHTDPLYPQTTPANDRLEPGPAYGEPDGDGHGTEDWPTYRGDRMRSGFVDSVVPSELELEWQLQLEGKLTPPVIANGKLYLASIHKHTLYALNESDGALDWSFIAGGRIDSPPTIYKGRVIFGCADGYVYCLRATDGAVIWRFLAAPQVLKMTSFEQLESVWPVSGSVLILNDIIYCVAGRSMFVDGGLRMLKINPVTGELISENVMDDLDPGSGQSLQFLTDGKTMPVALPDILSSDGEMVYMRSQRFDLDGIRTKIEPELGTDQKGPGIHLLCPTSLRDDTWFHRTYWTFGKNAGESYGGWHVAGKHAPSGRILAFDDSRVYGFGRLQQYYNQTAIVEYHLFSAEKYAVSDSVEYDWAKENFQILVRGIAIADRTLFVAGPEDVVDEEAAFDHWAMDPSDPAYDPDMPSKLAQQDDGLEDLNGALLRVVSTADGRTLAQYDLDSSPVFDGMIAANGRLYMALKNGKVKCFAGDNFPPAIDVGPNRSVIPAIPAMLDATVTDDGFPLTDPEDPCSLPVGVTCNWTLVSGPGSVVFGDANSVDTTAFFSKRGDYKLRLSGSDGSSFYYDDLDITVLRAGDLDYDNDIDEFDLDIFAGSWMFGECTELNNWCGFVNQSGSGTVSQDSFAVIALNWLLGVEPAAPAAFSATGNTSNVSLDWDDNTEPDMGTYNVYRSLTSGSGYTKLNVSPLATSDYVDSSVSSFVTYYYVVTAVDIHGWESAWSGQKSASPGPQPGVKLIAGAGVTVDANDLVIKWNDQAKNNDAKQDTWANRPLYVPSAINGEPAIAFDGSGVHLDVADSTDTNKGTHNAKTLVVVFRTGSDIATRQVIWEQGGGTRGLNFYLAEDSLYINGWDTKATPPWGPTFLSSGVSGDTVYIASLVLDSAAGIFEGFINGDSIGYVNDVGTLDAHSGNCALGHNEDASKFHNGDNKATADFLGLIAEFYEFNVVLSDTDRSGLEAIMMTKYGISP